MTGPEVGFTLLGALALGAGALAVTTRRAVHAVLWLAVTLAAVAGCFLVLAAELVAWIQILVYVGAVTVLLLLALMLTRPSPEPAPRAVRGRLAVAGAMAGATAAVLLVALLGAFGREQVDLEGAASDGAGALGGALFGGWVLPFEALSVLLLAALVGSVALSRSTPLRHFGHLPDRTIRRSGPPRSRTVTPDDGSTGPVGGGG